MSNEDEGQNFYEKVASYISRHPEFVEELQKRIAEDDNNYSSFANQANQKSEKEEKEEKTQSGTKSRSFLKFDEERINNISEELSGLLFDRDSSNKSVLEKTIQETFAGMVKGYLSKYAD